MLPQTKPPSKEPIPYKVIVIATTFVAVVSLVVFSGYRLDAQYFDVLFRLEHDRG